MAKLKSQGFTAVTALLVIVIIAAISATGWYVWQRNQKEKPAKDSPSGQNKEQPNQLGPSDDESKKWTSATTQAGRFSMKVPDGWKLTNYPKDFLGGIDVTHKPGTPAAIESSANEYMGHSLRFRASITPLDDAGLGPQWSSPQPGLEESTQDFSIGALKGKRYKGVFSQDLNQTLYEYVLDVGEGKKLDIVYTVYHSEGEKDDVATVEKAIKTIEVH